MLQKENNLGKKLKNLEKKFEEEKNKTRAALISLADGLIVFDKDKKITLVNPVAEKVVGCPILSFERSRVDPETGEKVLFSWWLMGQQEKWIQKEDLLLDIFDEGSHIQVIMEVKGVEASDLRLEVHGDQLTVRSERMGSTLKEIIHLPAEVNPDNHQMHLKNNLLEIKLPKV